LVFCSSVTLSSFWTLSLASRNPPPRIIMPPPKPPGWPPPGRCRRCSWADATPATATATTATTATSTHLLAVRIVAPFVGE
jgi:hypothetical protein